MLALPRVNLPALDDSGVPFGVQPPVAAGSSAATASTIVDADPAAPRRGFLSGFFSNLGLNWTRR
jgi:hypothetical protein